MIFDRQIIKIKLLITIVMRFWIFYRKGAIQIINVVAVVESMYSVLSISIAKKKNERAWILFALNSSVSVLLIDFISFHFYFPFHDNSNR